MNFISVCSGIEAASVAFAPLGWKAIAFSEIEPFPRAVLAHHYPDVPNFGDMSRFREWPQEIFANADAVVGGPPCQAFSVAGARSGLNDDRGNLTLIYAELINHADAIRARNGKPPVIVLYENVPGLLSDKTGAFGCFLGRLAGEDCALEPPGGRWADAGCVYGPKRAIAWRVLDAQFFGLAQRRRRVFVVASARDGFDPAEVIFEFDGLRRDSAPSREPGEVAPTIPARSTGGGGLGADFDLDGGLIIARCLTAGEGKRQDYETCTMVVQPIAVHPTQDPISSTDGTTHALSCGSTGGPASFAVATTSNYGKQPDNSDTGKRPNLALHEMAVRSLSCEEAEILQGFPWSYTAIPWRGKPASDCPDGPRFKALGNSWAVPVVAWIGKRIDEACANAAPACPVSAITDGTVDPADPTATGRLSAEASEFLLDLAYDADRAAEYASTRHQWVKELKELQ